MHAVFGDPFSVIPPKLSRDGETVLAAAEIGSPIEDAIATFKLATLPVGAVPLLAWN